MCNCFYMLTLLRHAKRTFTLLFRVSNKPGIGVIRRRRGARPAVGERRGGLRTTTGAVKKKERPFRTRSNYQHVLHVVSQPSRTGAALQDVVGLRFDGGHHVVEIAQVQRRKQHSEQEGSRLLLLLYSKTRFNWHYCGPFRFKMMIKKKTKL